MRDKICVAFCIDNNYTQHLGVAIASLLMHNRGEDVTIYVASSKLDDKDIERLDGIGKMFGTQIVFKQLLEELVSGFRQHLHLSRAAYYRILLADILQDVPKVIYLDCDLVVEADLRPLWEVDVTGVGAGGVDEQNPAQTSRLGLDNDFYINSGVLLLNLDYWRQYQITAKCMQWLEDNPQKNILCDQDSINCTLMFQKKRIDLCWNLNPVPYGDIGKLDEYPARVLHFGGPVKPWHKCYDFRLQAIYKKYLDLTPWAAEYVIGEPKNPGQACLVANQLYDLGDYTAACRYYQRAIELRLQNNPIESKLLLDCINGGHRHFNEADYFHAAEHYRSCVESWGFLIQHDINIYTMPGLIDGVF